MHNRNNKYIERLARRLKLEPSTNQDILLELQGHISDRTLDLQSQGLTKEEAEKHAAQDLGNVDVLADDMYSVHSQGNWKVVLIAALPHLLLAALFALHLWTSLLAMILSLALFTLVAYKGWNTGRARWAYSWIGYSLAAPTISWIMSLMALGYAFWIFATTGHLTFGVPLLIFLIAYFPVSLWVVVSVTLKVIRRDWLLASLTALPFPFLTSWVLFLNWEGGHWAGAPKLQENATDQALVFVALAITTAVFLKIGHRVMQICLLSVSTTLLVIFTIVAVPLSFGFLAAILLGLASVAFLLSPAILEPRLPKHASPRPAQPDTGKAITNWFEKAG